MQKTLVTTVLVAFGLLTGLAVMEMGYIGFFEALDANLATITVGADLVIALSLVLVWLVRDARARGTSPVPFVILTLLLGSVGPLVYLLRRGDSARA